jgi:hypothetical protein
MNTNQLARCAVPLALFLGGCYSLNTLDTAAPPRPATIIVAELTDSGTVTMANKIGAGAQEVEGIVSSADASTWNLNLTRVDHRGGFSVAWSHELVSFPRDALTQISQKKRDTTRSWLAGVGIAGCAFLIARAFHALGADQMPNTTPIPPN